MTDGKFTDQAMIDRCLDRVLSSPLFSQSPRQQALLRYLVNQTRCGNSNRLKGYVIGIEVFGRGPDFDPAVDAIVRVEAGRLRIRLRDYYQESGLNDEVRFELPKGGYAINLKEKNSSSAQIKIGAQARPIISLYDEQPTLAVLPLVNLSAESGHDYFVDGLTDSLIFELSRLSGLFLISRQSSFAYRNSTKSSETIATELGVKYLVEGSVQRSGSRVRLMVQLIDTSIRKNIWSDRFDRDVKDFFALQDDLTRSIVKALQIKLAPAEAELFGHEGTTSIEAHDALLRGLECHWRYTPKFISEARNYFSKALEFDNEYAAAHAWLARSMLHLWMMKWDRTPGIRDQAMAHALKAVELSPRLPYANAILGWVNLWFKNRESSIHYCRQAVSLDPNNPELLNFLSMALSSSGFGEEALFYIEKAKRLNPHSSPFYEFVHGQAYFVLEDYEKASLAYQRGCGLSDTFIPNHIFLCTMYALFGMEKEMNEKRTHVMSLIGGDIDRVIETPWIDEKLGTFYDHLRKIADLI